MAKIFESEVAANTTCSNLIMAGILKPVEVPKLMASLLSYSKDDLAMILCTSRQLYDNHLENDWCLN